MTPRLSTSLCLLLLLLFPAQQALADTVVCDADDGGLDLPEGFCAQVVADQLGFARHLVVTRNNDVYVAIADRDDTPGGLVGLRDSTGDGRLNEQIRFGERGGTGIAMAEGYLYFGEDRRVLRYRLHGKHLGPEDDPEIIAYEFPEQDQHGARSLALDGRGGLYVNVGAPSNNCQRQDRQLGSPGQVPCPELSQGAGIWRFTMDQRRQSLADAEQVASGIRNAVAIAWNPRDEVLYAAQHGRDQLGSNWPHLFDDAQNAELPSEELLRVEVGSNFGWPYCYHDAIRDRRVLAPEYGGNGETVRNCDRYAKPELAFPAHMAPNDLLFYRGAGFPEHYRNGAFIAFHGSWDRSPLEQRGYKVAFVPTDEYGRVDNDTEWEVFADGFTGTDAPPRTPEDARFRPMGLAQGPDGSLYISDSQVGRIWRVHYIGETQSRSRGFRRQAERLLERFMGRHFDSNLQ